MALFGIKNHWWVLISFVLAIPLGYFFGEELQFFEYIGTAFINLLKMIIVPLVTFSIINAIGRFEKSADLRRLGLKTMLFYMSTSLLAIVLGLTLINIIQPGVGVNLPMTDQEKYKLSIDGPRSLVDLLLKIIPENPIKALAEMKMLNVIFFSILFGAALSQLKGEIRTTFLNFSEAVYEIMIIITGWVIKLVPIGIFGLIIKAFNQAEVELFDAVVKYLLTVGAGLLIHLFITQPLILYIFTRKNPYQHFRRMSEAIVTVLATASSLATMPVTMKCVEEKAGVPRRITNFVIPLGATVNMDGGALFECAGALFVAQVLGFDLTLTQQLMVVFTALLASIGAAGVPSGGIVVIFIVLESIGIRGATSDFIVGIMLAVDRPLDLIRGVVNIFGDSIGAVVIHETEKKKIIEY
ncbi:MAG: dicarboxylate/amino acid:cation symporter [Bacteroidota bacterium]